MKKYLIILFLFTSLLSIGQNWNIANGVIDWTPDNSPGMPTASPNGPGFYHNTVIVASINVTINGSNNDYPLCPSPTILTYTLTGGATFSGTLASDAVSTSGDWESRFSWSYSDGTKTTIIATQISTIPSTLIGTSNTFSFQVLTPSYSSVFRITTGITAGTGTPAATCGTSGGFPRTNQFTGDDAQSIDGFTNRALPIQYTDLTLVDKQESGIQLLWKTVNEKNTKEFEIERRYNDNKDWLVIGKSNASGNTLGETSYKFLDNSYVSKPKIYYRIKAVDNDGKFAYTNIRSINLSNVSNLKIQGYPNPVQNIYHLSFTANKEESIDLSIIDLLGRTISTRAVSTSEGTNYYDLDVTKLPQGAYVVRLSGVDHQETIKFVKQ